MAGKVPTFREAVVNTFAVLGNSNVNLTPAEQFEKLSAEKRKGVVFIHLNKGEAGKNETVTLVNAAKDRTVMKDLSLSFHSKDKGSLGQQLSTAQPVDVLLLGTALAKTKQVYAKYNNDELVPNLGILNKTFIKSDLEKVYEEEFAAIEDMQKAVERRLAENGVKAKAEAALKKEDSEFAAKETFDSRNARIADLKKSKKSPVDAKSGNALKGKAKLKEQRKLHKEIIKLLKEQKKAAEGLSESKAAKKAVKKDLRHEYESEAKRLGKVKGKREKKGKDTGEIEKQIDKAEQAAAKFPKKKAKDSSSESESSTDSSS